MQEYLKIRGAKEHNLKNIDVDLPKNKFIVITGLSGSGKSSLAFDTIYAEGQRRYVESLSSYAKQFLHLQNKPNVESISGLSPAIAIDQKTTSKNPRSTVGTITEIYDYLRLLYARVGVPYSPATGLPIKSQSVSEMVDIVKALPEETKIFILSPMIRGQKGEFRRELMNLKKHGYQRLYLNGELCEVEHFPKIDKNKKHTLEVVIDRVVISNNLGNRIAESLEASLAIGEGLTYIEIHSLPEDYKGEYKVGERIIFSEKYSCPESGFYLEEIEPRIFSFNSPFGACKTCEGFGSIIGIDPDLAIPNKSISVYDNAVACWNGETMSYYKNQLVKSAHKFDFPIHKPIAQLTKAQYNLLWSGNEHFEGITAFFKMLEKESYKIQYRVMLARYRGKTTCPDCNGTRLRKDANYVKVGDMGISELVLMPVSDIRDFFKKLKLIK